MKVWILRPLLATLSNRRSYQSRLGFLNSFRTVPIIEFGLATQG